MLDNEERSTVTQDSNNQITFSPVGSISRLDIGANDIIITGTNPSRISQKEVINIMNHDKNHYLKLYILLEICR